MKIKRDYYEILGVSEAATAEEIKASFRRAAMKWHPDRNHEHKEEAEMRFREACEAFSVLSDPRKRKVFDTWGNAGLDEIGARRDFRRDFLTSLAPFGDLMREATAKR
jgi:DnaJ-class molecular chaperone